MTVYNSVDGSVVPVSHEFLDDFDQPIIAKSGYPQVRLVDKDKALLSSVVASPSDTPGKWDANLSIPNLGISDKTEFRINWRLLSVEGNKHTHSDLLIVEPKVDSRVSDVVTLFGDMRFSFTVPVSFNSDVDEGTYQIYQSNTPLLSPAGDLTSDSVIRSRSIDKTTFTCLSATPEASLTANLLRVDITLTNAYPVTYTYKLWAITPQIALAMSYLQDFLNKSRIENVIPELRYNDSDLLSYLERGLNLFNMIHLTTAFTGTNMQGMLLDAWLLCSCYYALGAQLLAEGSLAFDFSGQGINLNVDRTPQLDSALGRIESAINDRVVPLKKQLAQNGHLSGDGSIGKSALNNPYSKATLAVINAATTRVRGISNVFIGRRV